MAIESQFVTGRNSPALPELDRRNLQLPEVATSTLPERNIGSDAPQTVYYHSPRPSLPSNVPGYEVFPTRTYYTNESHQRDGHPSKSHKDRICGLRRKTFWIITVIAAVIIGVAIGAGIAAVVLLNRSNPSSAADSSASASGSTSSSPSSSSSSSSSQASASASAHSSGDGSASASATAIGSGIHPESNLATVNWTSGGVQYLRLYYQDASGTIMQSGWSSKSLSWEVKPISVPFNMRTADNKEIPWSGIDVKNGTPIAASNNNAATSLSPFLIDIFYLNTKNQLQHISTSNADGPWTITGGQLADVHENSTLASQWVDVCQGSCAHYSVPIYQNPDGEISTLDRATWSRELPLPGGQIQAGAKFSMLPTVRPNGQVPGARVYINNGGRVSQILYDGTESVNPGWKLFTPEELGKFYFFY
jgi:hypothetical protein